MYRRSFRALPVNASISADTLVRRIEEAIAAEAPFDATFVNPFAYYVYGRDADYRTALSRFDAIAADGIGVVLAKRLLGQHPCYRVSFDGTSFAPMFMSVMENRGLRVALVGGAPQVSEGAATHFLNAHPRLRIVLTADGYEVQVPVLASELAAAKVDAVVLGMGIPAQEKTAMWLRENGWDGITITCGGYFDQIVAGRAYYPSWVNRLNIRFLYRLYKEPRRLWRRYLVHYWPFVLGFAGTFITGRGAARGTNSGTEGRQ
jgi:exopolysaccharide biosynthesis WecB/TagA/CpsF family protein